MVAGCHKYNKMSREEKMKIARSTVVIAKLDEMDLNVTLEQPLTCKVDKKKVEFNLDKEMFEMYMNVVNTEYDQGKISNPELDSKLKEEFDKKYYYVDFDHNLTVSPLVIANNLHHLCASSKS